MMRQIAVKVATHLLVALEIPTGLTLPFTVPAFLWSPLKMGKEAQQHFVDVALLFVGREKIVIKVELSCHKLKAKAMEIASVADGVTSIAVGEGKDQVVVIGESVDPVKLTSSIRKKVCRNATLILVEEVKPKDDQKPLPSVPLPYPYPPAYTCYSIW